MGAPRSVRTFRPPTGGPSGSLGLAGTRVMLTTAGTSPSSGSLLLLEVELEVLEGEREEGLLTKASGSEDCLVGASLSWGM